MCPLSRMGSSRMFIAIWPAPFVRNPCRDKAEDGANADFNRSDHSFFNQWSMGTLNPCFGRLMIYCCNKSSNDFRRIHLRVLPFTICENLSWFANDCTAGAAKGIRPSTENAMVILSAFRSISNGK